VGVGVGKTVVLLDDDITVTTQVLDVIFVPSADAAVISAVPAATAVTMPLWLTVATFGSLESHVKLIFDAFVGNTASFRAYVEPGFSDIAVGLMVMPVIRMATVTTQAFDVIFVPSVEVAVIFAVPTATAVTMPLLPTVAKFVLLDDHVTT